MRLRYIPYIAVLVVAMFVVGGCTRRSDKKTPPSSEGRSALSTTAAPAPNTGNFQNYTLVVPSAGPRIWAAEVKSGKADSKTGKLLLTGITCHMYEKGKEVLTVTADSANAAITGKTVNAELSGHVRAVDTKRGQHLTSNTMRWSSTERKIYADDFYWIGEGISVRADQGIFSSDLTEADFRGHVRMESSGTHPRR